MKKLIACLTLALAVTSCGPASKTDTSSDTTTTKNTTTTTTASSTPDDPAPAQPASAPAPAFIQLTQANLDRVQNDMSQAAVEAILGQPSSSQSQPIPIVGGTQTTYSYTSGSSAVTIVFKNNQVKEKSGSFGP